MPAYGSCSATATGYRRAPAFWRGARSVLCESFDAQGFRELVARERVTTVFLVPTMIAALVEEAGGDPAAFASLRTIVYGAAPMPGDLLARALEVFGPVL